MKLIEYARRQGISDKTAWRWWKAGTIRGYQAPTGTIIVTEGMPQAVPSEKVAISARVASPEHRDNLERRAARLRTTAPRGTIRWLTW